MRRYNKFFLILILLAVIPCAIGQESYQWEEYLKLSKQQQFTLSERKTFILKAIQELETEKNDTVLFDAYISYAYILNQEGKNAKAYTVFEKSIRISDSIGYHSIADFKRQAYYYNIDGILNQKLGLNELAMEAYYKSLLIYDSLNSNKGKSLVLNNISHLYFLKGNTQQALHTIQQALAIEENEEEKNQSDIGLFNLYTNLTILFIDFKKYDSANYYLNQIKPLLKGLNSYHANCNYLISSAKLLYQVEKYDESFNRYHEALLIAKENDFREFQVDILNGRSRIFIEQKKYDKAEEDILEALSLVDSFDFVSLKSDLLYDLSTVYEKISNTSKSLALFKTAKKLEDSLRISMEIHKYSEIEDLYKLKLQNQENKVLESALAVSNLKLQRNNIFIGFTVLGSLFLLLVLLGLFKKRKFEKTANIEIQAKNKTIMEQKEMLHKRNEDQLKENLHTQSRQLTTYALSSLKQAKATEETIQKIDAVIYNYQIKDKTKKELKSINRDLKHHLIKTDWEEFKTYYEKVQPSFYKNLKQKYPSLSVNDEKMCAFISLGLSTKEIAILTFRQVRSVESARLRLRKKFDLERNDDLFDFLSSF